MRTLRSAILFYARRHARMASSALFVVALLVLLIGVAAQYGVGSDLVRDIRFALFQAVHSQEEQVATVRIEEKITHSQPTRLKIPRLSIDTHFVPVGLNDDGTIGVPGGFEEVGWYTKGTLPGDIGPAVVLGHVDSKAGPAVFYYLGQLKEGDSIYIEREDGSSLEFRVDHLARYPQDEFPTESVYGAIDHPGLRLITCSGVYKKGEKRYTHNLVVYASLVSNQEPIETKVAYE